jgi:hypothetical protein
LGLRRVLIVLTNDKQFEHCRTPRSRGLGEDSRRRLVHTDAVQPGARLAGRYRLEERMQGDDATAFWRATDELLCRSVGVRTLSADSTHATALVSAARAASLVSDPRFLHVLDVSEQDGQNGDDRFIYVVSEWVQAVSLGTLIRGQGPLDPEEARRITGEVAQALALTSRLGLAHRAINPECVLRTESGAVKLAGLGVDAAATGLGGVNGADGADGAAADARAVGALLYVALTARWPDGPAFGFPAALREHGQLCTPRQVRAGVPADLDAIAERALTDRPRHGQPLRTPAAIAAALSANEHRQAFGGRTSLLARVPAEPESEPGPEPATWPGRLTVVARAVAALLLVAGVALVGWQLAESRLTDEPSRGNDPSATGPTATRQLLPITSADDFDPEGDNGEEHPREVPLATDRDPDTAWHTQSYLQADIGNKSGVGLLLDLGSVKEVHRVLIRLAGDGTDVELRVSETDGEQIQDYRKVATKNEAGERVELTPKEPARARFVIVWLTKLPPSGGQFRGGIADVKVSGVSPAQVG